MQRYRKDLVYPEGIIRLFEFELNVFSGQSLHKKYRSEEYGKYAGPCICWHFDIPSPCQVVAGFKDEPLHISTVMNINDPHDLLKLAIKGHITPPENKLYSDSPNDGLFSWMT